MQLPYIPEPSEEKVRDRVDARELERMYREGSDKPVRSWEIQQAINSYIWEHWKGYLEGFGLDWQEFQSETRFANNTIEAWAADRTDWESVLSGDAKLLDAEIEQNTDNVN